jgi:hypothetical protein
MELEFAKRKGDRAATKSYKKIICQIYNQS